MQERRVSIFRGVRDGATAFGSLVPSQRCLERPFDCCQNTRIPGLRVVPRADWRYVSMSFPLRNLPVMQNWDCHSCSDCCRIEAVITDEEKHRIEALDLAGNPEVAPGPWFAPAGRGSQKWKLTHRPDGGCVFLTTGNRCRIQERFGAPRPSRSYAVCSPSSSSPRGTTGASACVSLARQPRPIRAARWPRPRKTWCNCRARWSSMSAGRRTVRASPAAGRSAACVAGRVPCRPGAGGDRAGPQRSPRTAAPQMPGPGSRWRPDPVRQPARRPLEQVLAGRAERRGGGSAPPGRRPAATRPALRRDPVPRPAGHLCPQGSRRCTGPQASGDGWAGCSRVGISSGAAVPCLASTNSSRRPASRTSNDAAGCPRSWTRPWNAITWSS